MTPTVGMPATISVGSDRYPATVVKVSGNTIVVQQDEFKAAPGHDYFGSQKWEVVRNPEGPTETWTLRKNGKWCRKGVSMKYGGGLALGHATPHQDPHK